MIINIDREPELSLYYLGSVVLQILFENSTVHLDGLYIKMQKALNREIQIDFYYYTLDWLYMLSLIKLDEGKISICE